MVKRKRLLPIIVWEEPCCCGDEGDRTPGLLIANQPLYQLSYIPKICLLPVSNLSAVSTKKSCDFGRRQIPECHLPAPPPRLASNRSLGRSLFFLPLGSARLGFGSLGRSPQPTELHPQKICYRKFSLFVIRCS